jgi:hypothetical protein
MGMTTLFEGVSGYAYGNSWLEFPNYDAEPYFYRLAEKLGLDATQNLATSGFRIQDTAINAYGADAKVWPTGEKGVVVVGDLLNNLIEPDDARNRTTALESMRALVALLSSESRIEQNALAFTFSTSPAWGDTLTADDFSGGSTRFSGPVITAGGTHGYVDIAVPAGSNYLVFSGLADAHGCTFIISEGDTELARVSTLAKSYVTPFRAANGRSPIVYKVPGTTARTIRATIAGESGYAGEVYAFVDALLPQSQTPPLVILVKPLYVPVSSHNKPALLTYLRTVPDTVAAEFSNVLVVDPAPGCDADAMLGADQLHPNEAGQEHIAVAIQTKVQAETTRRLARSAFGTLA